MSRTIKFIWDFRGPDAEKTARHHSQHLTEYCAREALTLQDCGSSLFAEQHWTAWMLVEESQVNHLRGILRPQRGVEA